MKIIRFVSILAMSAAGVLGLLDMTADIRNGTMIDYEHAAIPSRASSTAANTGNTALPVSATEAILSKYTVVEVSRFFVTGFSRGAPNPGPQLVFQREDFSLAFTGRMIPSSKPEMVNGERTGPLFAWFDVLAFTRVPAPPKIKLRVAALKPDELRIA